jgi:hypothetical protein
VETLRRSCLLECGVDGLSPGQPAWISQTDSDPQKRLLPAGKAQHRSMLTHQLNGANSDSNVYRYTTFSGTSYAEKWQLKDQLDHEYQPPSFYG